MVGEVTDSSYFKVFLSSVIPNNIIRIFVSDNMLSILIVATTIGLGLADLPERVADALQLHFSKRSFK